MLVITIFCIIGMVVLDRNKIVCSDLSADSNKISKAEGIASKNAFQDRKNVYLIDILFFSYFSSNLNS